MKCDVKMASFSKDRVYRYALWRSWYPVTVTLNNYVNFIMLNPSTADESTDDATIRKCIKFAKSWGYYGLIVTNLFAYRSTDRKVLRQVADPIGPENDSHILWAAREASRVIAAWSQDGDLFARSAWTRSMLTRPLHYLRMGKKGEPYHPLYLPDNSQPILWEGR